MSFRVEETGALHIVSPTKKISCPRCGTVLLIANELQTLVRGVSVASVDQANTWTVRCRCKAILKIYNNDKLELVE